MKWTALQYNMPVLTLYVQPDHFLGLGDNSPESSDSRSWGLVPKRLLLGKAVLVYYPFGRMRPALNRSLFRKGDEIKAPRARSPHKQGVSGV